MSNRQEYSNGRYVSGSGNDETLPPTQGSTRFAGKSVGESDGSAGHRHKSIHWPRHINNEGTPSPLERQAESSQQIFDESRQTSHLYDMSRLAATQGATQDVDSLIHELVARRGELPNSKHYGALILVNVGIDGSASRVSNLLQEMISEGIPPDSEVYHCALKALAVHPDTLLRSHILEEMRKQWFNLTASGWHDVVAGCVREDQLELAFDYLDEMRLAGVEIAPWLYELITFSLCDHGELDEALRLLQHRAEQNELAISPSTWYYLFDAACELLHHDAIQYFWQSRVEPLYLAPTTGHCLSVLNSASRCGNVSLATDVFRILTERGFDFKSIHYELLMATYMAVSDLETALTIACIMNGAGVTITPSSIAPILAHLKLHPSHPLATLKILQHMAGTEKRIIPTAVVTCLIEGAVHHCSLPESLTIYKELHKLSPSGPDVDTFNALFRGCYNTARNHYLDGDLARANEVKETTMFLASEMLHLKVVPDALTYDRLVLVCLQQRNFEDAFRYYEEMREFGFWPRRGTWIAMISRLKEEADRLDETRLSATARNGDSAPADDDSVAAASGGTEPTGQTASSKTTEDTTRWVSATSPLSRAWALVHTMKHRHLPTEKVEQILLGYKREKDDVEDTWAEK